MAVSRFSLLLLLLLPVNLLGASWYVSTTGNDSTGNGSIGSPWRTVAYGVSQMAGGDTLFLRGGTYAEAEIDIGQSKNGTAEAYTTICSYPGEWAIIDASTLADGNRDYIIGHPGFDKTGLDNVSYWKFERLELTGAHSPSDTMVAAIYISGGPHVFRYLYIHDNFANNVDGNSENPAGIVGMIWDSCIVEYCYFKDNGTENETDEIHSGTGIQIHSDYYYSDPDGYPNNYPYATHNNTFRYNLFQDTGSYAQSALHDKANQYLAHTDGISDITTETYRTQGNKIHHNIFLGIDRPIGCQVDFTQIYNNILYDSGTGIEVTDPRSTQGHMGVTVYNNTLRGGGGITMNCGNDPTAYGGVVVSPYIYWYNNILDQPDTYYGGCYLTIGSENMPTSWSNYSAARTTLDRNYIYRSSDTSNQIEHTNISGTGYGKMSVATYNSNWSVTNYSKDSSEGTDNLYAGATGADQYITRSAHIMSGSTTIGAGGIGGSHPYLAGVTIPGYVGATNPDDNSWVAGVLALDASYMTSATAGSDPAWIEGSTEPAPPTLSNVTISNGSFR